MPLLSPPNLVEQAVDTAKIRKTLFVIPQNDGEACRSLEILAKLEAPWVHKSEQSWGAVLDRERLCPDTLNKVDQVLTFELPSALPNKGELCVEERLKLQGVDLKIIDHHKYGWIDRSSPLSSIEQLCQFINWRLDRVDLGIAINDRSYIGGLRAAEYSDSEILDIRYYDLVSQGHSLSDIEILRKKAQEWLQGVTPDKGLWFIEGLDIDKKWVMQELALREESGLVNVVEKQPHKVSFSGDPRVVAALNRLKPYDFAYKGRYICYSGGDPGVSQYWIFRGMKPLGQKLMQKILDTISVVIQGESHE